MEVAESRAESALQSSVLTGREVYNGNKSISLSKRSFSHPVSSGGARSQQCGEEAGGGAGSNPATGTRVGLWCSPRLGSAPHLSPPVPEGILEWGGDAHSATIPMDPYGVLHATGMD